MTNFKKSMLVEALLMGACLLAIGVWSATGAQNGAASKQADEQVPTYKVDPSWPKPLPNNWTLGMVRGIAVDKNDHIWVMHGPSSIDADQLGAAQDPPRAECCLPAPPVLVFDQQGNLIKFWGNPESKDVRADFRKQYDWFSKEHSVFVDPTGNVWLSGNDSPTDSDKDGNLDRQILKFTTDGKFLLEIGHSAPPSADHSLDKTLVGSPAGFAFDEKAHELYVADGYLNRRVIVFNSDTGAFKRMWGAYGNVPSDAGDKITTEGVAFPKQEARKPGDPLPQQFGPPVHCVALSNDGLVYVCDRGNARIQVFTKEGKFVKEFFLGADSACKTCLFPPSAIVFSRDKDQKYLLVSDGQNNHIWTVRRSDGVVLGKTGRAGQDPGEFHRVHSLATDAAGNLYTGELNPNDRIQRFVLVGGKAGTQISQK